MMGLINTVVGMIWTLITAIAHAVFFVAGCLFVLVAVFAFYQWFSGKRPGMGTDRHSVQFLFARIGEWIQAGCDAFATHWKALCLASVVACVLSAVSLGILAGPMTAGLAAMALAAARDRSGDSPSLRLLWGGPAMAVNGFLFICAQLLLSICGAHIAAGVTDVGEVLAGLYVAMIQTVLMFGMLYIADGRGNAITAISKSAYLVSSAPFVFLMLYAVAAALGGIGGIFFGIGMILTLPLQLCVLAVAYNELVTRASATLAHESET